MINTVKSNLDFIREHANTNHLPKRTDLARLAFCFTQIHSLSRENESQITEDPSRNNAYTPSDLYCISIIVQRMGSMEIDSQIIDSQITEFKEQANLADLRISRFKLKGVGRQSPTEIYLKQGDSSGMQRTQTMQEI